MVKHPKRKGSAFEIIIYNDMKTYLTDVKRVGGSGTQGGENGDVICTVDIPDGVLDTYCVECKHYKTITPSVLDKWWKKIIRQAKEIGLKPLLIYRQNRQPILLRTVVHYRNHMVYADMKYLAWKGVIKKCLDVPTSSSHEMNKRC